MIKYLLVFIAGIFLFSFLTLEVIGPLVNTAFGFISDWLETKPLWVKLGFWMSLWALIIIPIIEGAYNADNEPERK